MSESNRVLTLFDPDAVISNRVTTFSTAGAVSISSPLSLVRGGSFCRCGYSLGAHGAAVERPVCDVRHISRAVHSAISAATETGVPRVRSTTIGVNLDGSPATNAFVRNVRYASVTSRGL